MAKNSENILDKARRQGLASPSAGMSVPEGYFSDFATRMAASLPERPEIEREQTVTPARRLSIWQNIRPYVYMAAMFAGVWCMLQLFASITGAGKLQPMSENPLIAKALASEGFVSDYIVNDLSSRDVLDQMMEDGTLTGDNAVDDFWAFDDADHDADYSTETNYILPQ